MTTALLTDSVTPDLDRAVRYALLWGLEGVAVRSLGHAERVPHVNEARLRRRLEEADLPLVAVDPGLFEAPVDARSAWLNDLAAFGETARFCRRLQCPLVITGALAGPAGHDWSSAEAGAALSRLAAEAHPAGVRIAVRNDASTACRTGSDLAAVLAAARAGCADDARPALGAAWSPSAALEAGSAPAAGIEALISEGVPIYCVAVDDSIAEVSETSTFDEPHVDWAQHVERLVESGFAGPFVLEVRRRPVGAHGLRAATGMLTTIRSAQRAARA